MKPDQARGLDGLSKMSLDSWQQATLALQLLALDPGLGGVVIRARSGPVRDAYLEAVKRLPGPLKKVHPAMADDVLFGGLDLPATLAAGSLVEKPGLLDGKGTLVLTMAERCAAGLAARLAMKMDQTTDHRLIALDEGASPDEAAPAGLIERCAFHVDLTDIGLYDIDDIALPSGLISNIALPENALTEVTEIALRLGIDSLRAPMFALWAAKGIAALAGRTRVTQDDIEAACVLTLTHRATQMPEEAPAPEEQPDAPQDQPQQQDDITLPEELVLDAIKALLPDDLLDRIAAQKARTGKGNGSGAVRKGNRRGRPLPARIGKLSDGARIDLIGTLRAAAPWQTIRRRSSGRDGLHIRQSDMHVKRFAERTDRLLIFAVDASGSAALARLAEAKGAIELLLAQAYARRDHVSLVAFRGREAELLLPPTRSLVQTKRRLASLPGGGGTPLAAGLKEALAQALQAKRKGLTPTVVLLTDGRANIALSGDADRKAAAVDSTQMAQVLRAHGIDAMVIDTGNRPERALKTLAATLDAPYLPLPRADAQRLSTAVATALDG
jgi:magnesium chelatase subunit D